MNKIKQYKGKVILAGAGPGDPELLTLKVMRYLQKADVVITDRLVSNVILDEFVNKEAQVLHVGKQCRKGASTPQSTINELIVDYALQGKLVVRLKGGDVSIFSNVLDELQVLVANHIEYEIVPGVTAALGAAAYAGIPLTARDHATAVRFLTYYKMDVIDDNVWKDLASTNDTLVFYMSSDTNDLLVKKLIESKIATDKHIAVIEQATTPLQNVYSCNVYEYAEKFGNSSYVSPTLIIIGKVVVLHQQFKWIENSNSKENYFQPVAKSKDALSRA
ncbi:MAG: uroporphyrinogen-III C-methyltransferase [Bacteroidetes bacterium]|nr:uroporphyrinogen-III C-methyltransferase [Bacteroidota bacterium]